MPTITSTGVGSGLDVNSIITSLMTLEQRPLTLLQKQSATVQTQLSAFGTLKGQIAALGDVASRLADKANWNPIRADSSDSTSVTATGTAKATAGRHTLEVQQLAQSQNLVSGNFASPSAVVGTGTLQIQLGSVVGGVFTPKAGTNPTSVVIGTGSQTLAGVRDAINAANAGLSASIVTSGGVSKLVLRGQDGAESAVNISVTDSDNNHGDTSGLSALAWTPGGTAGNGRNLTETQSAQNALYKLDGIDLVSASNSPTDVLEGVSLSLKKVTTAPVSVVLTTDSVAVRKNLNDFVKAYNDLNKLARSQTQSDPSGKSRGPLQADSTAVGVANAMREILRGNVAGLSGVASLSAAGLEVQRDGSLLIKEDKFAALLDKPDQLAALFAKPKSGTDAQAQGFGLRIKAWADALTNDTGPLASRTEGLQRRQAANDKQQTVEQDRIARTEARLRAQYQRLDTEMSRLKGSLNSLSQFTSG